MIHTPTQLKTLVRNKSRGNNAKAMTLIRNFVIKSAESIMDEAEYPGLRFKLEAALDTMKTPLKIDVSIDDVITPKEVKYEYKLMFEERRIPVLAYNLETVLAEKMETIISRGALNTRMRDYNWKDIVKNIEQLFEKLMYITETG